MREKLSYGLLISIILIATILIAGCSSSSPTTTTPVPTTATANKFAAGDIIAKSSTSTEQPLYVILAYDSKKDMYTRAFVYKNADGSWGHRVDIRNETVPRSLVEKVYPAKITHVALTSVPIVATTIPTEVPRDGHDHNDDHLRKQLPVRSDSKTPPRWQPGNKRGGSLGNFEYGHCNVQSAIRGSRPL